jgi:hypothetical protein
MLKLSFKKIKMKKVIYVSLVMGTLSFASCKKDITELNINPNRPTIVSSGSLYSNASVNLSDLMAHTNVNYNNFRLFVQYWTETIYRDETRYNLNQRSIPDNWFTWLYRDVIEDLAEASKVIDQEGLPAAEAKNRKAINEMLTVYAYYTLITSFGDVPYSEALNIDNLQPKYDNASAIFTDIAKRLDAALAAVDPTASGYGTADLILGGDVAGWMKFGNSLKMRMGMLIADVDPATSMAMVQQAAPGVIINNGENIQMHYLAAPPNTNPVWEDLIQSGRHDFVAAKPFIDTLKAHGDPRLPLFYAEAITPGKGFVGQSPGGRAAFNDFSAPSSKVSDPQSPFTFFSYSEMEFYKAEALARGIAVGGTIEEHYNNAITASIEEWGGTAADAAAYLAQPSVKFSADNGDFKKKIGVQSWIAFYNRGYEAWTQWRRLDWPKLELPAGAAPNFSSDETPQVIVRLSYPVVEQNLNKANYEQASSSIGNDRKTQKLWFDKF